MFFEEVSDGYRVNDYSGYRSDRFGDEDNLYHYLPTLKNGVYSFHIAYDLELKPNERKSVFTDWKCKLPYDKVLLLLPYSTIAIANGIMLVNSVGIIDDDYYGNEVNDGNIGVVLINLSEKVQKIKKSDVFCQAIIVDVWDEERYERYGNGLYESIEMEYDVEKLKENVKMINLSIENVGIEDKDK